MIQKAKSIDEIYEQVKNFDLVITNDAPLNTALNKLINKPMLGSFAQTARLLGSKYCNYLFEQDQLNSTQLILKIKNNFSLSLKEASFYVSNILNIWQHTGNLEEIKQYVTKQESKIIDFIKTQSTYQIAMEKMNLNFTKKDRIATINQDIFSNLDKKVLTKQHQDIETLTSDAHEIEPINIFDSKEDIIKTITNLITNENQNSIAIVLNTQSDYLPLIKAKLINKNIQISETQYLQTNFQVREFLSIIEIFFTMHNIYTKDIIPIANLLNIDVNSKKENYLFEELIKVDQSAKNLSQIIEKFSKLTYSQLQTTLEQYNIILPEEFKKILQDLEINKKEINQANFQELKYFIETQEIEIEKNKSGVLLVDCKNSTFIDKDIIFYVGMDSSWFKNISDQKYIQKQEELDKNLKQFQILIQQGTQRIFFIPKNTSGELTSPPIYFNILFNAKIDSYYNEFFQVKEIKSSQSQNQTQKTNKPNNKSPKIIKTISNSALKTFTQCPKKYSYSKLINTADKDFFLKGELIHSFAEFYFNYPELVKSKQLEEFVEIIISQLKPLSNPQKNHILQVQIKYACESIIEFLDNIKDITQDNLDLQSLNQISKKNQENVFALHYKKELVKKNAELSFKDEELKLNGIIDLAVNNSLIVDYKSGKKKSTGDIINNSNIENQITNIDFQPLVYLSLFRKINENQNQKLEFWYSFPTINTYKKIMQKELEENIIKVHYIPNFKEFFFSKEFEEYFQKVLTSKEEPIFTKYESRLALKDYNFNQDITPDENLKNEFVQYHLQKGLKETQGNIKLCVSILEKFFKFKTREKISNKNPKEVFYFKEDLDNFENFVSKKVDELNNAYKTEFKFDPIEQEQTCNNCDFKKMCIKEIGER